MRVLIALIAWSLCVGAAHAQSTVTANIHNACEWEPSQPYTASSGPPTAPFTRVNAGAGWTPTGGVQCGGPTTGGTVVGGSFTAGAALNNYVLTSGNCTSGASQPAWNTNSSIPIPDNTCTWKYVGPVDYVTITGWGFDNGKIWASGNYGYLDVVHTTDPGLPVFQLLNSGCNSTVKPTPANGSTTLSDGCYWSIQLASLASTNGPDSSQHYVYYSSNANTMPMTEMNWDHFQGTLATTSGFVGTGSYSGATLTITSVSSGTLSVYQTVSGPGVPAPGSGNWINNQTGGPAGCPTASVGSPCTFTTYGPGGSGSGTYTSPEGTLTITTPPATYPIAVGQIINYPGSPSPQTSYVWAAGNGIRIVAGSGTSWTTDTSASYTSTTSAPFFAADELNGVMGTSYQFNIGQIWNDREYIGGTNGEASPISMWNQDYQYNDSLHGILPLSSVASAGYSWGYPITLKPAPGEGFADTFAANPGLALAGYNENYGVGLRGVGIEGFGPSDSSLLITGLQFISNNAPAIFSQQRSGNFTTISHSILVGGSAGSAPQVVNNSGAAQYWYDNLVIASSAVGLELDYGGMVFNNTIVCPSGTCASGIDTTRDWDNFNGNVINGNVVIGFTHFVSSNFYGQQSFWQTCTWDCTTFQGTNNFTDVSSSDGVGLTTACSTTGSGSGGAFLYPCPGYSFFLSGYGNGYAVPFQTGTNSEYFNYSLNRNSWFCGTLVSSPDGGPIQGPACGATFSVSPSTVFAAWPGNYKITSSSPAYGAGASFPAFSTFTGWAGAAGGMAFCLGTAAICSINPNTPDLLGTARPQGGTRYDAGAVEFLGGTGTVTAGGHLFR